LYSFKIDDIQKSTHKKGSVKNLFKFLTYLICKNPLCNYDMEIRGEAIVNSPDAIDLLKISSIK
jgi:hypothetical protein